MGLERFTKFLRGGIVHKIDHDKEHIDAFHAAHQAFREAARNLHERGYHVDIEHDNAYAARHGRNNSSYDVNQSLIGKHTVKIKKGIQ